MSLKIKFHKWLIYNILLFVTMGIISCECKNPKDTNGNSLARKKSTPPPLPRNGRPTPPPNPKDQSEAIAQAIWKLEEEISKPDAEPRLKEIYEVIKLLPPYKFMVDLDGRKSRINEEKSGNELFDKIIAAISQTATYGSPSEAVSWLIDQQLLDLNELDDKGTTLIEKVITACIGKDCKSDECLSELSAIHQRLVNKGAKLSPEKASDLLEKFIEERYLQADPDGRQQKVLNFLRTQGFSLPPAKASILLEKLLEKQLGNNKNPVEMLEMVKFLETQGAAIPSQPAFNLLEKFIQQGAPPQGLDTERNKNNLLLYNHLFDLLEKSTQGITIDQNKATDLLQKAVYQDVSPKVYATLLDLGADPNKIQVNYLHEKMPLLHYVAQNIYNDDFKVLLTKLVDNIQTDINITDNQNLTLGMVVGYYAYNIVTINELLKRTDLDINTLKDHRPGTEDYTLLDIVVANCMSVSQGGHDGQQKRALEKNKEWLLTLKNMVNCSTKFYITNDNIQKATKNFQRLTRSHNSYVQEATEIAQEALDLLKNSPRRVK